MAFYFHILKTMHGQNYIKNIFPGLRFQRNDPHGHRTWVCDLPTPQTHRTDSWRQRDRPRSSLFRPCPIHLPYPDCLPPLLYAICQTFHQPTLTCNHSSVLVYSSGLSSWPTGRPAIILSAPDCTLLVASHGLTGTCDKHESCLSTDCWERRFSIVWGTNRAASQTPCCLTKHGCTCIPTGYIPTGYIPTSYIPSLSVRPSARFENEVNTINWCTYKRNQQTCITYIYLPGCW